MCFVKVISKLRKFDITRADASNTFSSIHNTSVTHLRLTIANKTVHELHRNVILQ